MNDSTVIRHVGARLPAGDRQSETDWAPNLHQIVIGKDVLELLSSSMYVDPMTIYREYIQNAADAIDEARERKFATGGTGKVEIDIDAGSRSIKIRDNGTGLTWKDFPVRLSNLGASAKRGTSARGFRGVGRLAGLGYCQELVFRCRAPGEVHVSELRWDCRRLKSALRTTEFDKDVVALVREIVSIRRIRAGSFPERFFEVELKGVVRHRNDRLLSPQLVSQYLSQVSPVQFSPEFRFGDEINAALRPHVALGDLEIRINGSEPIYRPHQNRIQTDGDRFDEVTGVELHEITGLDDNLAAVVWILHHGYSGAIPNRALTKGIRLRSRNLQVGDHALLEEQFPEPRFNAWAIGEVHVIDSRIVPNGRRDHFEQSVHLDNLINKIGPIIRDIARRCRQSSITRKWLRDFELHKLAAIEKAKVVARGGLSKVARKAHADSATKSLAAMQKVVNQRHLSDETREELASEAKSVVARITKLLGAYTEKSDPLARYQSGTRSAYQRIIGLIYECTTNRAAASALVNKILAKLEETPAANSSIGRAKSRKETRPCIKKAKKLRVKT